MENLVLKSCRAFEENDELCSDNLDVYLQDSIFIQFFNNFLSLQSFPHRFLYNAIQGNFEEFEYKPAPGEHNDEKIPPKRKNGTKNRWSKMGYYIKLLEKDEGLEWVKKHRLVFFKRSEIYAHYKLAKLLSSFQKDLFQKFFRPEWDLLNKLVLKSSSTKIKENEIKKIPGNQITNKYSSIPNNVIDELDKITYLSDFILTTPFLREKIMHDQKVPIKNHIDEKKELINDEKISSKVEPEKNIDALLRQLYRNINAMEVENNINEESEIFIRDFHQRVNDILLAIDSFGRNISFGEEIDTCKESFEDLLQFAEVWPINLSYKKGIDAFMEFLHDTPGEGNLLLWIKLERARNFDEDGKKRIFQEIKEKFFRSDSPYFISKASLKSCGVKLGLSFSIEELISQQEKILQPLLVYWCPRFSLHLYRKKLLHEKGETNNIAAEEETSHLPARPLSCRSHLKPGKMVNRNRSCSDTSSFLDGPFFLESMHKKNPYDSSAFDLFQETSINLFESPRPESNGITKQTRRAKSAHPRILSTPNVKSTNASYDQLMHATHPFKDGHGYKPLPTKYFPNDASDISHKRNVRLYVEPFPSPYVEASTLSLRCNFTQADLSGDCDRCNLDSLIDVLLHETHTGSYFLEYLKKQENKLWINCYLFWKTVQDYSEYFTSTSFAPNVVKRKSNYIYTNFIPTNSTHDIQCSLHMQSNIFKQLDPPFEDLFDVLEEDVLMCLLQPFSSFLQSENVHYKELSLKNELKFLEVPSSISKKSQETEEDEELEIPKVLEEHSRDKGKIPPELVDLVPQYADGFGFDSLLRSKSEMEHFRSFLELYHKQGITDLKAWTDFEVFRITPRSKNEEVDARDRKAIENREKWLGKGYFFGPHSPATKAGQRKILEIAGRVQYLPERPSTPVNLEVQKYIKARLERKWLVLFKDSPAYQERMRSEETTNKMVEDLLMQKQLRRGANTMKARHVAFTNAKLAALRMTISDPQECELFRKFIKVYGEAMTVDFPENNLDFWLEVQKYKDLCHNHVGEVFIRKKIQAIIDVYIKSSVPPEIQIDVSPEIAGRLYEKACGRPPQHSPYLFREAQTTVLRVMYDNWNEFVAFRQKFQDQLKLRESLKTSEVQYHSEITKRKLLVERKRLWKLLTDKNKEEHKEVDPNKVQDLLQLVQLNRENEESGDTTSFIYSKHLAEDDLNQLETRMKEQNITDFDKHSCKKSVNSLVSQRQSRKTSIGRKARSGSTFGDVDSSNPSTAPNQLTGFALPKRKSVSLRKFSLRNTESVSSDCDRPKVTTLETVDEMERETDDNSLRLTRQSLEEFSNSPEGKQLLPLVRIQSSRLPVIKEGRKSPRKDHAKQKTKKTRLLPKNAGTASIIAKREREHRFEDSPPPEINAVVVVH